MLQMLFTWDTTNLCIVFRQWHIRSTAGLVLSLVAVVLLGMGYEALRAASSRYETSVTKRIEDAPSKRFFFLYHPSNRISDA
jgi:solute carrier family 31 (copper transporter), member 1